MLVGVSALALAPLARGGGGIANAPISGKLTASVPLPREKQRLMLTFSFRAQADIAKLRLRLQVPDCARLVAPAEAPVLMRLRAGLDYEVAYSVVANSTGPCPLTLDAVILDDDIARLGSVYQLTLNEARPKVRGDGLSGETKSGEKTVDAVSGR